ncbi:hypothetical protein BJX70DRAFT_379631 [Aspergillus crustosus]
MEGQLNTSTYGQACVQCYKAKCRCVRSPGDTNCERCLRLRKRCQPSKSVRRRDVPRPDESAARIAKLEESIGVLLTAMRASAGSVASGSGSSGDVIQHQHPSKENGSTALSNPSVVLDFNEVPLVSDLPSPHAGLLTPSSVLSHDLADERIHFFRTRMLPYFPFIDLTSTMTSSYLRQHRPFLLQAICTVTTFSTQERLVQVEELKRYLFSTTLLQVQSDIDLLLGLLTYLAWSTDVFLGRADLVSRLMMLAISLVYDLRLFKPSSIDVQLMMSITQGGCDNGRSSENETSYEFLEKQRAVLACFMLSSSVSSHLGRQDALRWTLQMEEALRVLAITKSCPADAFFVSQVRLQLLKQKAEHVRQQDEMEAGAPRSLYLKTLRRQLDELRASIPAGLPQIDTLRIHAHYVELYIAQLGYSITHPPPPPLPRSGPTPSHSPSIGTNPSTNPSNTNTNTTEIFSRLTTLWQSVLAIKSWLDTFYTLPASALPSLPFHFWSQLIFTITLLKYLSTLTDPDWDCEAVRNKVHLLVALGDILERVELGSKEKELRECEDHFLVFLARLVSKCRVWGEMRLSFGSSAGAGSSMTAGVDSESLGHGQGGDLSRSESIEASHGHAHGGHSSESASASGAGTGTGTGTGPSPGYLPDMDQMSWMHEMDLGDDQWFQDVLGIPATLF